MSEDLPFAFFIHFSCFLYLFSLIIKGNWLCRFSGGFKRWGRRFSGDFKRRGRRFSGRLNSRSTKLNDEDIVFPEKISHYLT